jgi:hypothetical protein
MIPKWSRARHLPDARKNSPPHRRRSAGRSKTISSISAGESRCPSCSTHPESSSVLINNSAFNDCPHSIPLHSDLRFFQKALREIRLDLPLLGLFTGIQGILSFAPCGGSHAGENLEHDFLRIGFFFVPEG